MSDMEFQEKIGTDPSTTATAKPQFSDSDQVDAFLKQLRNGLAKVPKALADDAIQYYEEYLADARQSGSRIDEVLDRIGTPDQVVRSILDDLSITSAHDRPSAAKLIRTSRRVMGKGVARAAAGTSLAIVSVIPFSTAIILYATAFVLALAALAIIAGLTINIATHPELGTSVLLGQIGLAAAASSILLLAALVVRLGANGLARSTLKLYRKIIPQSGKPAAAENAAPRPVKRRRFARALSILLLVILAVGQTLSLVSGLPQQYWRLWNSLPPADVEPVTMTLAGGSATASKLEIRGLNANITLLQSSDNQLKVTYDQAPYVQLDWSQKGSVLQLSETGNGRLPGFNWLAVHEGTASLTVYLPGLTDQLELDVETKGGDVTIRVPVKGGRVRTINGDITFYTSDTEPRIGLSSRNGRVTYLKD